MMEKVLYISYDGMTDPLGRAQVIPYLQILSTNFEIHILSFEKKVLYCRNSEAIHLILKNHNIAWHPLKYNSSPPVLSSIYDILKMYRVSVKLCKKHNYSIIHARSYMSSIVALKLKQKFSTKFIFDMRGFWADERVDGKLWKLNNPLYKHIFTFFKKKEKQFLTNADYVVSLTYKAVPYLNQISGNELKNIEVIPCCVDTKLFDFKNINLEKTNDLKSKLNISENDFVLSYLGSIGTWYMLDEMLDFFAILKIKNINAKFLFITNENPELIKNIALRKNISFNDIIIVSAKRDEVPSLLSLSSCNIYFIQPCFSKNASSPTKLAEVLSMGIPVITNSNVGDIALYKENSNNIITIDDFTSSSYQKAIILLDQELSSYDKHKIRNQALELFDLEKGANIYKKIYLCLTQSL